MAAETRAEAFRRVSELAGLDEHGCIIPPPVRLIDRDKLWDMFCKHYWDSITKDRDLILSHIVGVMTRLPDYGACPLCNITTKPPVCKVDGCPIDR